MTKTVKTMREFRAALGDHSYSRHFEDGHFAGWDTKRLWRLADAERVIVAKTAQFQPTIDKWMDFESTTHPDGRVTVEFDVNHFLRIRNAQLKYPIIVEADGVWVMDGMHRLMKCYLGNIDTIRVVQFAVTPEPDFVYYPKNEVRMW